MHASIVATSFWNEPIVTTIKELEPIRGGAKLAIISCILSLPIKYVEIPIVTISILGRRIRKTYYSQTHTISDTRY